MITWNEFVVGVAAAAMLGAFIWLLRSIFTKDN